MIMTHNNWFTLIMGMVILVAYDFGGYRERRKQAKKNYNPYPYDWTCPLDGCEFHIQSTDHKPHTALVRAHLDLHRTGNGNGN